jgi:hypothetical protein
MWVPVPDQTKVNQPLFDSQAEGFSATTTSLRRRRAALRPEPRYLWLEDPPVTYGRKVIISDTDHYAPAAATTLGLKILSVRPPFHPAELRIIDGVNRPTRCR